MSVIADQLGLRVCQNQLTWTVFFLVENPIFFVGGEPADRGGRANELKETQAFSHFRKQSDMATLLDARCV